MKKLSKFSEGFDMGCGSGMWDKFVAPKVGLLNCIDSSIAIRIAKKKLRKFNNIKYHKKSLDRSGLKKNNQDFGYSLGVLHHVPDTKSAIHSFIKLLKPGSPFLLYIYYNFDNRLIWYKYLWLISDYFRSFLHRLPKFLIFLICDFIASLIYFSVTRIILTFEKISLTLKIYLCIFISRKVFTLCTQIQKIDLELHWKNGFQKRKFIR